MIFCPFFLLLAVPAELACQIGINEATAGSYSGQNPDRKPLRSGMIGGIVTGIGNGSRTSGDKGG